MRDLTRLQNQAIAQMEQIDKKLDSLNRVRVGDFYWEPDEEGKLHLACDSAPVNSVKILGMERVLRARDAAKGGRSE